VIVDKLLKFGQLLQPKIFELGLDYFVNFSTGFVLNVILSFLVGLQDRLNLLLVVFLDIVEFGVVL
jgi:hypothetical protein